MHTRPRSLLSRLCTSLLSAAALALCADAAAQEVSFAHDEARACGELPRGPWRPWLVTEAVYQSEELAFDARGLIAKKGEELVAVPAFGPSRVISRDPALATLSLGLRILPGGDVLVAQPALSEGATAKLLRVRADGSVSEWFSAASMPPGLPPFIVPNGLDVDGQGNAYVSDVATNQLLRISAVGEVGSLAVGEDAQQVGGLVYDGARSMLFYTGAPDGTVRRVRLGARGQAVGHPEVVGVLPGTRLDGVTLDRCGNLYLVDSAPAQQRYRLLRLRLDGGGAAVGAAEELAAFDDWVSGVQFGAGPGYDPRSAYVSSIWGKVYRVPVGVRGAQR
jgi:hypothetical protein